MKSDDFRCKNCGGLMRFDPKSGNLKCENCGTEYRIEKEELEKIVSEITEMNISCDTSLCNTCDIGCFD